MTLESNGFLSARNKIERFPALKKAVKAIPLTANQITAVRVPIGAATLGIHASGASGVATAMFAANSFLDWVDGFKARADDDLTEEGKSLDPLCDKVIIHPHLLYGAVFIMQDTASQAIALAGGAADAYGQWKRGEQFPNGLWDSIAKPESCTPSDPDSEKGAKTIGKIKMILQCVTVGGMLAKEQLVELMQNQNISGAESTHEWIIRGLLVGSTALAVKSAIGKKA